MLYIDNSYRPVNGVQMCKLTSDTVKEMHAFAKELGLNSTQHVDSVVPHYVVPKNMRKRAIELGAIPVQHRQEPWRCPECFRSMLPHTKTLKCKCKKP